MEMLITWKKLFYKILISKDNKNIKDLASNSIVGTSSFRREFQLKKIRGDLNYKLIRGNVDTRIKKLKEGFYDAIILSKAGIDSLKLNEHITEEFTLEDVIPSVGQGIVAVQCRQNDTEMIEILKKINHEETHFRATAEREVLKILEGDCDTAIVAISLVNDKKISLTAELFSIDGKERYFIKESKELHLAKELGRNVGESLKNQSKGNYKR